MTKLSDIKAITFDVDGTLWDFDTVMRRALGEVLMQLKRLDPEASTMLDVERVIGIRDRAHEELRGVVTDLNEVRVESFRQVLRDADRPDDTLASHLADVYFEHRDAGRRLFGDALPTLESLQAKYTLGIISNGNSYPKDFGLEHVISFGAYSQDHGGIEKPDPRIFEIALESAGCSAGELVHVGDSLENDVAGARSAGIRSVWLNRNGDSVTSDVEPDAEIKSLGELPEIL